MAECQFRVGAKISRASGDDAQLKALLEHRHVEAFNPGDVCDFLINQFGQPVHVSEPAVCAEPAPVEKGLCSCTDRKICGGVIATRDISQFV